VTTVQSPVEIGRMVLSILGVRSNIESFSENSDAAKKINIFYNQARRQALSAFDWSFARKVKALASHATAPDNGWAYRYQIPVDFVQARGLVNPLGREGDSPASERSVVGTEVTLQTNEEQAVLIYTYDVTFTEAMPPSFISAFAHLLAYYVAPDLMGEAGRKERGTFLQLYEMMLGKAMSEDANSEVPPPERDATWIRDR